MNPGQVMTMSSNPERSLSAILRKTLGDRLAPNAEDLLAICAEDVVFEFPFSPAGGIHRLEGKQALSAYLPRLSRLIRIDSLQAKAVYRSTDPDTTIIEMEARGAGIATGTPYDQRYISVVRTRDGRVSHYRDYWNPLILLEAVGGEQALAAALLGNER
jgi:uncharacterized protein